VKGRFGASQLVDWAVVVIGCVSDIGIEHLPQRGRQRKVIAVTLKKPVIEKLHLR